MLGMLIWPGEDAVTLPLTSKMAGVAAVVAAAVVVSELLTIPPPTLILPFVPRMMLPWMYPVREGTIVLVPVPTSA